MVESKRVTMAQRYVRIRNRATQQVHYGLLQFDRTVNLLDAPPWLGGEVTGVKLGTDGYQMMAPCAPSKIVAVGRNYQAHAAEMGEQVPTEPLLFLKPSTTIIADGENIYYPKQSQRVDYEGELAVVIGDRTKNCSLEDAKTKIWGYTIANDVTARDLQQIDRQWTRAKGFDTFCPLGPWIVKEISPDAQIQTFLNDQTIPVQSASINQMVFTIVHLIHYISGVMTLLPGDIILTGTPDGIGPIKVGDRVRIEIQGIGSLENTLVANNASKI